eukprot:1160758-Pelagomonas_calceolata.AAC.1
MPVLQTSPGENVYVVGNIWGKWDPKKGQKLKWSDGHIWRKTLDVPIGQEVEFKVGHAHLLSSYFLPWAAFVGSGFVCAMIVFKTEVCSRLLEDLGMIGSAQSRLKHFPPSTAAETTIAVAKSPLFLDSSERQLRQQVVQVNDDGEANWESGDNRTFKVIGSRPGPEGDAC